MHDTRPALARYLWRDHTQEHWAYSLAVELSVMILFYGSVLVLLYVTRHWWVPVVLDVVCR